MTLKISVISSASMAADSGCLSKTCTQYAKIIGRCQRYARANDHSEIVFCLWPTRLYKNQKQWSPNLLSRIRASLCKHYCGLIDTNTFTSKPKRKSDQQFTYMIVNSLVDHKVTMTGSAYSNIRGMAAGLSGPLSAPRFHK